jgi:hypothetical protein
MNDILKVNYQEIKNHIDTDKVLKATVYIGITVASLYLIGQVFKGVATAVRGYKDLKAAFNGN